MGGNALKNVYTRRYEASEYYPLAGEVLLALRGYFPDRRVEVIPAYRNKPSFGDLDILLSSDNIYSQGVDAVHALFKPKQICCNSNVISFDYKEFQVDLIQVVQEKFQAQMNYFSYNDLGNFMGRMAKQKLGVVLGQDGLLFRPHTGTRPLGEILLTRDWSKILPFLGYKYEVWAEGFDNLEDIFYFASSSPYCSKDIFRFENLNYANRVRDVKRANYRAYVEWLEKSTVQEEFKELFVLDQIRRIFEAFPHAAEEYTRLQQADYRREVIKFKFNGNIVGHLTNLSGKELGLFMGSFRKSKGDDWLFESPMELINQEILCSFRQSCMESAFSELESGSSADTFVPASTN